MSRFEIFGSLATAAAFLALAIAAVSRGRRHPMAGPFGQLTAMLAVYKLFEPASDISGNPAWDTLEFMAATLVAPPVIALLAAFVGVSRRSRWPRRIATAYFGALALSLVAEGLWPSHVELPHSRWSLLMLAGLAPTAGPLFVLLLVQAARATGELRSQSHLFVAASVLGVGGVATDLLALSGYDVPRLAGPGLLASVLPLGLVALESDVIKRPGYLEFATIIVLAMVAIVSQVIVFALAGGEIGLFAGGSVASVVVLVAAIRPLLLRQSENRHRERHLATLGRLSEQMAHDLRNPLAALLGSIELLNDQVARTGSLDAARVHLGIIESQAKRMNRVVDDYRRLGSVRPVVTQTEPHLLVRRIASGFRASLPERIQLRMDAPDFGALRVDADLLEVALENLLRNAREALNGAGQVTLRFEKVEGWRAPKARFTVQDDGPGMDASTAELAFEEAFTTKATGTGLGLSYVRRVAEAHGGVARLTSRPGHGTTVWFELPWRAVEEAAPRAEPDAFRGLPGSVTRH